MNRKFQRIPKLFYRANLIKSSLLNRRVPFRNRHRVFFTSMQTQWVHCVEGLCVDVWMKLQTSIRRVDHARRSEFYYNFEHSSARSGNWSAVRCFNYHFFTQVSPLEALLLTEIASTFRSALVRFGTWGYSIHFRNCKLQGNTNLYSYCFCHDLYYCYYRISIWMPLDKQLLRLPSCSQFQRLLEGTWPYCGGGES